MHPNRFRKKLFILILISTLVRLFLAWVLELGNDEVYYWTYALFPDWSHFDHPPMVGIFIQTFSLNLLLTNELFIRLSSVVFAALNTWLFFQIGKHIKNELTGWYAALLYTASLYTSLIVGVFILPDTPQVFFWLVSIYLMVAALPDRDGVGSSKRKIILLGISIGFAMLSKYSSIYLWFAAALYILFYNRLWLKTYQLYLAILLSLLILSPVIYWNFQNDFISFTFQGERANIFNSPLRFDFLATEIGGQFLYNNPFVFILTWIAVFKAIFKNDFIEKKKFALLLFLSLPLIATFLFVALFRQTLPHWTGPAYLALMLITASYLSGKKLRRIHWAVQSALAFLFILVFLAVAQINYGLFNLSTKMPKDPTLDMYGWDQLNQKTKTLFENDIAEGIMPQDAPILSWRWFPAAHLDFYVAQKNHKVVKAIGKLERIHKYAWINQIRGGFHLGMDAYFITFSNDFEDPKIKMKPYFEIVGNPDTIPIIRAQKTVKEAYIYRLKNMKSIPTNELN